MAARRDKSITKLEQIVENALVKEENFWDEVGITIPSLRNLKYKYPKTKMETTRIYTSSIENKFEPKKVHLPDIQNYKIKSILETDTGHDITKKVIKNTKGQAYFDTTHFNPEIHSYLISSENDVTKQFLYDLLSVRVSEIPSKESEEYDRHWIAAMTKDVRIFEPSYNKVEFEDVGIDVGVSVGRHFNTVFQDSKIPLKRLLLANKDIIHGADTGNRNLIAYASRRRRNILKRDVKKSRETLYDELNNLCLSDNFRSYIDLDNEKFSLIESSRSESVLTFANMFLPIPSGMSVQLYTTLDIDEPAQKGNMLFNRNNFRDDVMRILRTYYKIKI